MRPNLIKSTLILALFVLGGSAHAAGTATAPAISAPRVPTGGAVGAAHAPMATGAAHAPIATGAVGTPGISGTTTNVSPGIGSGIGVGSTTPSFTTGATSNPSTTGGAYVPNIEPPSNGTASMGGPGNVRTNCSAPYAPSGCGSTQ